MTSSDQIKSNLNGLVLAGGKSSRMGSNKDQMIWHEKEQKYYMADLIQPFCNEVFISCREEQMPKLDQNYAGLKDTFIGIGPTGGILSALNHNHKSAWLVVACDLPLLDVSSISFLVKNRDSSKIATTFKSPFDGLPEPLITIWEPSSYQLLLEYLNNKTTCPRKLLINSDCLILDPPNPEHLMNVNTPKDAEIARKLLSDL